MSNSISINYSLWCKMNAALGEFVFGFFSCFNVMLGFFLLFHCSGETLSVGLQLYFHFTLYIY